MFLNKDILVEILKTYPGSEFLEEIHRSQIKTAKPSDSFWKKSTEGFKKWMGYNYDQCSESSYLELRSLIDDACERENIHAWAKILCTAGEAAHTTLTTSYSYNSQLCNSAFAIRAYILYQIQKQLKSIEPHKPKNANQLLALKIKKTLDQRIMDNLEIIRSFNHLTASIDKSNYAIILNKQFKINVNKVQNFQLNSTEMIEIAQRHLYFLGHDLYNDPNFQNDRSLKPPMALFPRPAYSYYNITEYTISPDNMKSIKHHLPMCLQPLFISVHLRNKRENLKTEQNETTVIASFEQQVRVRLEEEQKLLEAIRLKKDEEEFQKNTPSELPIIPERDETDVPILADLQTPNTPKQAADALGQSPKKEMKFPISNQEIDKLNANGSLTLFKVTTPKEGHAEIDPELPLHEMNNPEMTKSYVFFPQPSNKPPVEEEMKKNEKSKKKNIGELANGFKH
ncbi:MAG TPA: hypothetical protein VHM20_05965 [Gammaproteobacteria bacterium]|nr:hypothetical protein [Gammaproteobacteria bacterium]